MKKNIIVLLFIICLSSPCMSPPCLAETKPIEVKKDDKCPVCGMFVAKYRQWIAQIVFHDGTYTVFDGPKDMFKFYLSPGSYSSSKRPSDIAAVYVTEYYSTRLMDAKKMFYVTGSDVYGPMGAELIPLASESAAKEFMMDHKGGKILKFNEVTSEHLK
jgi:nitrous oxide reductase accessory protein NosL